MRPEHVLVDETDVYFDTEYLYQPADFGYDNYGNKVMEHPFAYLNDEKGTWAIEADLVYAEQHAATTSEIKVPHTEHSYHEATVYNAGPVIYELP